MTFELPAGAIVPEDAETDARGTVEQRAAACPFKPSEFYVIVELDPVEKKTPGGIILVESMTEREELATDEGTLIAVSPVAFTYANWPDGARIPQVGDRVLAKRYDGILRKVKVNGADRSYRIIPDKSLVAVIEEAA